MAQDGRGVPVIRIWSSASFCAAHRLYSPTLNEKANLRAFGKCVNTHGHNYTIKVILRGAVNPTTGYVYSVEQLDEHLNEVICELDHRDITDVIGPGITCTVEHLSVYCWEQLLRSGLPKELLFEVKVCESSKIGASYRGEYSDDA